MVESSIDGSSTPGSLELADAVRRASQSIVAATRAVGDLPALPMSQVTALRALVELGPATPGRLANALGLARPTVSNLMRDLVTAGLIERQPSSGDGRQVSLTVTEAARTVLRTFSSVRLRVMSEVMASLEPEDQAALGSAVMPLTRLSEELGRVAQAYEAEKAEIGPVPVLPEG